MKVFVKTSSESMVPSVLAHSRVAAPMHDPSVDQHVAIVDVSAEDAAAMRAAPGLEVYDDIQFRPFPVLPEWWEREGSKAAPALAPAPWLTKTMADVMKHNRAAEAWATTRGKGVTIAVVDTGTDLTTNQFPTRASALDVAPSFAAATADIVGHGSMCAAIALGSDEAGGRYKGVAPEATLLTARSTLNAADLYLIYQHLLREKRKGSFPGGLVVSNSYGLYRCSPPQFPQGHPYVDLVRLCVREGIVFVFAAGNNHGTGLCQFPAADDHPNTIWSVNSIDEVISVGTVDWNESNQMAGGEHANSSRGPGQWSTAQDKPDVVAPTYGEVVWGGGYNQMEWWGTSGACPQVAGAAALLLAKKPSLTPSAIRQVLRATARGLGGPANCVGSGILDCVEALKAV